MHNPIDLNRDGHVSGGEGFFAFHFLSTAARGGGDDDDGGGGGGGHRPGGCGLIFIVFIAIIVIFTIFAGINYVTTQRIYEEVNSSRVSGGGNGSYRSTEEVTADYERLQAKRAEDERLEAQNETPPSDLAEKLPYQGMNAFWIDQTWLGPHDEYDDVPIEGGQKEGATTYMWKAKNGTNDTIFYAYVRDYEVIAVSKGYSATDYWPDLWGKPDLYASGKARPPSIPSERPDPADYDDPDDYADDAEAWYTAHGSDDPYADAVEDWEANY